MKSAIITFIGFFLFQCYGQENVELEYFMTETDTVRKYIVLDPNRDAAIEQLVTAWGAPATKEAGTIRWLGLSIKGYPDLINAKLTDGIITTRKNDNLTFKNFRTENHKQRKLDRIKPNQERFTTIEFLSPTNERLEYTELDERKFLEVLSGVLDK